MAMRGEEEEEGIAASGEREEGVEEGAPSIVERSREASRGRGHSGRRYFQADAVDVGGRNRAVDRRIQRLKRSG